MLPTPSVEYGLLSPMLIVFGVAVAGVLVEAFLPRRHRYSAQVVLTLGGLVAAFVAVVALAGICTEGTSGPRKNGRDGGRRHRPARVVPAGHHPAHRHPGHPADRRAQTARPRLRRRRRRFGRVHPAGRRSRGQCRREGGHPRGHGADRGVPADHVRHRRHAAVPGRRRPADHVHRPRSAVAAAVSAVRAGAAPPAAVAGSGAEILSAGRLLVGVLPLRHRAAVRLQRHVLLGRDQRGGAAAVRRHPHSR